LSTESSLSASADFDFDLARHSPPPSGVHHRLDDPAQASALRLADGAQRIPARSPFAAPQAVRGRLAEALPQNDFLKDLHREMRRAERSQTALSLVLYRVDDNKAPGAQCADRLLEVLYSAKRETDFLGHVDDDMIAVLCPDTDEQGTKGFMRKIDALASDLPFTAVAANYPDDLFESLAKGTRMQPAFQPFLVSDAKAKGGSGYPLKRCLDVVGSIIAICLLGPLMVVVAAVIALTSNGPMIFKQTRLGKGGVPFTFYKFRSMVTNVDDGIHREFVASLIKGGGAEGAAAGGNPAPYKLQSDPRVTSIGRFIRKTSIDELPQFFNVLKGDMSLVGPRPPIPYEAAQYQSWHMRRVLAIKPGITGIWQVEGRSKVTFNEMVRMDLRYIRDCSLALDLKIMLKTIVVVIRCDGAG
jgi:lipopolysaccharide/colanic/teichoic acid biosynthesis glycosyltransferase